MNVKQLSTHADWMNDFSLSKLVNEEGGFDAVCRERRWTKISVKMGFAPGKAIGSHLRAHYERILYPYNVFQTGDNLPVRPLSLMLSFPNIAAVTRQLSGCLLEEFSPLSAFSSYTVYYYYHPPVLTRSFSLPAQYTQYYYSWQYHNLGNSFILLEWKWSFDLVLVWSWECRMSQNSAGIECLVSHWGVSVTAVCSADEAVRHSYQGLFTLSCWCLTLQGLDTTTRAFEHPVQQWASKITIQLNQHLVIQPPQN